MTFALIGAVGWGLWGKRCRKELASVAIIRGEEHYGTLALPGYTVTYTPTGGTTTTLSPDPTGTPVTLTLDGPLQSLIEQTFGGICVDMGSMAEMSPWMTFAVFSRFCRSRLYSSAMRANGSPAPTTDAIGLPMLSLRKVAPNSTSPAELEANCAVEQIDERLNPRERVWEPWNRRQRRDLKERKVAVAQRGTAPAALAIGDSPERCGRSGHASNAEHD